MPTRFGGFLAIVWCLGVTVSGFGPARPPSCQPSITYTHGNSLSLQPTRRRFSHLFFGLSSIEKKEAIYLEAAANNPGPTPEASTGVHVVTLHPNTDDETLYFTEHQPEQYCLLVFESDLECQYFVDLIEVGVPGNQVEAVSTPCSLEEITNHCQDIQVPIQYVPNME